jgi:hypothetical protein
VKGEGVDVWVRAELEGRLASSILKDCDGVRVAALEGAGDFWGEEDEKGWQGQTVGNSHWKRGILHNEKTQEATDRCGPDYRRTGPSLLARTG